MQIKCCLPYDASQHEHTDLISNIWITSQWIIPKHFLLCFWWVGLFLMHEIKSVISVTLKTECVLLAIAPGYKSVLIIFQMLKWNKKMFCYYYKWNTANTGKTLCYPVISEKFYPEIELNWVSIAGPRVLGIRDPLLMHHNLWDFSFDMVSAKSLSVHMHITIIAVQCTLFSTTTITLYALSFAESTHFSMQKQDLSRTLHTQFRRHSHQTKLLASHLDHYCHYSYHSLLPSFCTVQHFNKDSTAVFSSSNGYFCLVGGNPRQMYLCS